MKVKMIDSGKTTVVNDSYASRLVQQGKAVVVQSEKKPATKKSASSKTEGDS